MSAGPNVGINVASNLSVASAAHRVVANPIGQAYEAGVGYAQTAAVSKVITKILGASLDGGKTAVPFESVPELLKELDAVGVKVDFKTEAHDYSRIKKRYMVLSNIRLEMD